MRALVVEDLLLVTITQ